jgi:hypothetical protein
VTSRKQALENAAEMLKKAENNAIGEQLVGKYLSLGQLWMALAHELNANYQSNVKTEA